MTILSLLWKSSYMEGRSLYWDKGLLYLFSINLSNQCEGRALLLFNVLMMGFKMLVEDDKMAQ